MNDWLYLAQQLIHALPLGCIYALLAIAHTLVYNLTRRMNLAFGDMATVGAYAALFGLTSMTSAPLVLRLAAAGLCAASMGMVLGWSVERFVFRRVQGTSSQAPLVATIGLVIGVQEYLRLIRGAGNDWLRPILNQPYPLVRHDGFMVSVTLVQGVLIAVTIILASGLWLLRYHRFGRHHQSCSEDAKMAALCGVDIGHIIKLSFILGTIYACMAGFMLAVYYGVVNFYMGFVYGLKALTAAIVGGIGSVSGALMGGILIAMLETLWSAYLPMAYRDMAVFGLLITVLVLRPVGLLGQERNERMDHRH